MSTDMGVSAEFDQAQLRGLQDLLGDGRLYDDALEMINKFAVLHADREAKKLTPVRSGHARRSTVADTRRLVLEGRYPYLDWLDKGEDERGRVMRTPRGGYQIRAKTKEATLAALPEYIDRAGREIAKRWAS